jgi:hypothetical protein
VSRLKVKYTSFTYFRLSGVVISQAGMVMLQVFYTPAVQVYAVLWKGICNHFGFPL